MKKTYRATSLLLLSLSILLLFGCSSDSSKSESSDVTVQEKPAQLVAENPSKAKNPMLTFEDTLTKMLNDPWERILHEDYSGFYENEFSYLTDEVTLDEYLTYKQVTYRYPMDVTDIKVLSFDRLDDSAFVDVTVTLVDTLGNQSEHAQALTIYYTDGRWIKPTVSVSKYQHEYEDKIRQAIEDAEEE